MPPPGRTPSVEKAATPEAAAPGGGSEAGVLAPGQRVGKYEVLSFIAAGGMGEVYRARDPNLDRVVALKVMKAGAWATDEEKLRFLREAEAAAKLQHPNIVQVYDSGLAGANHYFTMDFVEGQSLGRYAKEKGLGVRGIFSLMAKVAGAVGYAHLRGIIHRDLKPSNILVGQDGEPRIMDFGLAKQVQTEEEEEGKQITLSGQVMGTPSYMSPEQAEGHIRDIDVRSDIYTLGIILYELIAKDLPFKGNFTTLLMQILTATPTPLRNLCREANWEVEAIVEKAMAREKERRYQSAFDLQGDLAAFVDGRPISARKSSAWYRGKKFVRRNPAPVAAFAVAVLALLGVVSYLGYERYRASREARTLNDDLQQRIEGLGDRVTGVVHTPTEGLDPEAILALQGSIQRLLADGEAVQEEASRLKVLDAALGRDRERALDAVLGQLRNRQLALAALARQVADANAELPALRGDLDDLAARVDALARIEDERALDDVGAAQDEIEDLKSRVSRHLHLGIPEVRDIYDGALGLGAALDQTRRRAEERTAATQAVAEILGDEGLADLRERTAGGAERLGLAQIQALRSEVSRFRGRLERYRSIDAAAAVLDELTRQDATLEEHARRLAAIQESERTFERIFGADPEARLLSWRTALDEATAETIGALRDDLALAVQGLDPIRGEHPRFEAAYAAASVLLAQADSRRRDLAASAQARAEFERNLERARAALALARRTPVRDGDHLNDSFQTCLQTAMDRARSAFDGATQDRLGEAPRVDALAVYVEAVYRLADAARGVEIFPLARFAANLLVGFETEHPQTMQQALVRAREEGVPIEPDFRAAAFVERLRHDEEAAAGIDEAVRHAWSRIQAALQRAQAGGTEEAQAMLSEALGEIEDANAQWSAINRGVAGAEKDPRIDIGRAVVQAWTAHRAALSRGEHAAFDEPLAIYRRAADLARSSLEPQDVESIEGWLRRCLGDRVQAVVEEARRLTADDRAAALRLLTAEVLDPLGSVPGVDLEAARSLAAAIRAQESAPDWAVLVPRAANFQMPAGSETITLAVPGFYVGRTEVTNHLYRQFVAAGGYDASASWWADDPAGCRFLSTFLDRTGRPGPATWADGTFPEAGADLPVSGVSYFEACAFCRWMTEGTGRPVRLPTEIEWSRIVFWGSPAGPPWRQDFEPWRAVFDRGSLGPVPSTEGGARYGPVWDAVEVLGGGRVLHIFGNVQEWVAPPGLTQEALSCDDEQAPVRGGCYRSQTPDRADPSRRILLRREWRPETVGFRLATPAAGAEGGAG